MGIRDLIEEIEAVGFGAKLQQKNSRAGIKEVMQQTVKTYQKRFLLCLLMWLPIMIMMYIIPYIAPKAMTSVTILNGITLYIVVFAFASTVI